MSQAIYYIDQNSTMLTDSIPKQAINIPIETVFDKETLLTSLAKAGNFPSYFAYNWDSAWDCLTDSNIRDLKLSLTEVKHINNEDLDIFKSIIEDAYKDFGKPQLWIEMPSKDK